MICPIHIDMILALWTYQRSLKDQGFSPAKMGCKPQKWGLRRAGVIVTMMKACEIGDFDWLFDVLSSAYGAAPMFAPQSGPEFSKHSIYILMCIPALISGHRPTT